QVPDPRQPVPRPADHRRGDRDDPLHPHLRRDDQRRATVDTRSLRSRSAPLLARAGRGRDGRLGRDRKRAVRRPLLPPRALHAVLRRRDDPRAARALAGPRGGPPDGSAAARGGRPARRRRAARSRPGDRARPRTRRARTGVRVSPRRSSETLTAGQICATLTEDRPGWSTIGGHGGLTDGGPPGTVDPTEQREQRGMKRIARAVTCVLGTLAASAALAAGAGAATPTWYECGKAPKLGGVFTGNYSAKNCEAASEVQGGGKYELREGIGKGKRFKGKGGASTLNVASTLGSVAVQCASSAETGTPALPNLEKGVSFTFKKCVALGSKACTTASAKSGEITITGLKGTLSEIEEAPEVAVTLESEAHPGPEGVIATFTCEGLTATIQGSITARQTQDVNVVTKQFATIDLAAEPYSGPEQSIAAKGEALMVRTGSGASEPPRSVLI